MKKMTLYIVAGVAALLIVVGGAGATAYVVMTKMTPPAAAAGEAYGVAEIDLAQGGKAIALKPFVTNLADGDRPRYINVTFELIVKGDKEAEKVETNLPLIRDGVVAILNKKTSMEVTGEDGRNKLKSDVQERVNSLLGGKYVQQVLITDYVVQF